MERMWEVVRIGCLGLGGSISTIESLMERLWCRIWDSTAYYRMLCQKTGDGHGKGGSRDLTGRLCFRG